MARGYTHLNLSGRPLARYEAARAGNPGGGTRNKGNACRNENPRRSARRSSPGWKQQPSKSLFRSWSLSGSSASGGATSMAAHLRPPSPRRVGKDRIRSLLFSFRYRPTSQATLAHPFSPKANLSLAPAGARRGESPDQPPGKTIARFAGSPPAAYRVTPPLMASEPRCLRRSRTQRNSSQRRTAAVAA